MRFRLWSTLDDSSFRGDLSSVEKILQSGTYVNKRSRSTGKYHRTPLHAAVLGGHLDVVNFLIQRGAQVNAFDDVNRTPLHYAASLPNLAVVEALLDSGADYTLRDTIGNMPVHVAIQARNTGTIERLRQESIDRPLEVSFFEDGAWRPYDSSAAASVSLEMGEGSAYCSVLTASGHVYIVDFRQKLQINVASMFAKSICWRVPPSGAWHYPPYPFQGLHKGSQDPAYLRPYAPLLASLRSQGLIPSAPLQPLLPPPLASYQGMMRVNSLPDSPSEGAGSLLNPRRNLSPSSPSPLRVLRSGSVEHDEILARFVRGMEKPSRGSGSPREQQLRPVLVSRVYEVVQLGHRVRAFERALEDRRAARGAAEEKLAWHGAPFQSLERIITEGFKLTERGRNGRLFGHGVYFAPEGRAYTSAEFATPDDSGEKHMLLCRLVVGSLEVVPFESAQEGPSSAAFDIGTDNLEEPSRYIVWEDDVNEHVLPTHIVSFKYC